MSTPAVKIPPLLTTGEVAAILRVSRSTVHEWATSGTLPSIKLGKGPRAPRRFDPAVLREWIRARAEGVPR